MKHFSAALVSVFNLLPWQKFSVKSFSGKISFPVKKSYLPTFSDDKAEILAVSQSKLY